MFGHTKYNFNKKLTGNSVSLFLDTFKYSKFSQVSETDKK